MYIYYNSNPDNLLVGDCVIRGVAYLIGQSWDDTYMELCAHGLKLHDMPSANRVWEDYLRSKKNYKRSIIPDTCPNCYTVREFCRDHPTGLFLLAIGNHVVPVQNGDYYDTWDSGDEVPIYYWRKEPN